MPWENLSQGIKTLRRVGLKKLFLILTVCFAFLNSFAQEVETTVVTTTIENESISEQAQKATPENYSFIVNRRVYKLDFILKDNVPYFSLSSIFNPLSSIGMTIEKQGNKYIITYEEKEIALSLIKGTCTIPPDPEIEKPDEDTEITKEKQLELEEKEALRQKDEIKVKVTSVLENKKPYVTGDFLTNALATIMKKQIGFDANTGTFFIGNNKEIKINYSLKEEKDYAVLKLLCPAQIKYSTKTADNLMTITINSVFNIDKEKFLQIESKYFTVKDVYFQSNQTILTFLLTENVYKTYSTFDSNFSTLKLYFYSKEYYNPKPIVTNSEINEKSTTVNTVIIDPGHGGDDIGAKGKKGVMEKDITLAIAFKLSKILRERGYKVVMTRYSDTFVPLKERTGIANNNKGDIFISIHVNASVRKAYGAETYYLSLSGMEQVSDTVAFENRMASRKQKNSTKDNSNESDDLMFILWDMAQTEYLKDSAELAEEIQTGMNKLTGIRNRGVKQAALVVLKGLNMPGVLVEVAFLSNPKEETKLTTDSFQKNAATAIANSIDSYKTKYEARMNTSQEPIEQNTDIENNNTTE